MNFFEGVKEIWMDWLSDCTQLDFWMDYSEPKLSYFFSEVKSPSESGSIL